MKKIIKINDYRVENELKNISISNSQIMSALKQRYPSEVLECLGIDYGCLVDEDEAWYVEGGDDTPDFHYQWDGIPEEATPGTVPNLVGHPLDTDEITEDVVEVSLTNATINTDYDTWTQSLDAVDHGFEPTVWTIEVEVEDGKVASQKVLEPVATDQ